MLRLRAKELDRMEPVRPPKLAYVSARSRDVSVEKLACEFISS